MFRLIPPHARTHQSNLGNLGSVLNLIPIGSTYNRRILNDMARPLRLEFAGALYHITARGNAKQEIFLDDDDRTKFLSLLGQEVLQLRWKCYSYCLMDNHYHLVIETPEGNLVSGAKRLNGVYSQWFNRRHGRVGHLFQGRYKSIIVDKEEYLLELCRYVVLNPVRAGIVSQPGHWKWSSYLPTMGLADRPACLDTELILEHLGPNCAQPVDFTSNLSQKESILLVLGTIFEVRYGLEGRPTWRRLRNGSRWIG